METYSYSKLSLFETCPHAYFITYVLKQRSPDNIYSTLGSTFHDLVEGMQQGEIENEEAVERFIDDVEFNEILGLKFMSEKVKNNYVNSIVHFLKHFKPLDGEKIEIEKEFELELEGFKLMGFIDMIIHRSDGTIDIYDFKTSSLYSKKDLPDKAKHLLIYALAMEDEGFKINSVSWYMGKYAVIKTKRGSKTVLRSELVNQEYEECFVSYPCDEETKKSCLEWVYDTVREIEKMDIFDTWEKIDRKNSFYCQNICCNPNCERFKQLKIEFAKNNK